MQSIIVKMIDTMQKYPNKNAIFVENVYYTYQQLFSKASALSKLLLQISNQNSLCAIYSNRTIYAYQSILGALLAGKAYMPINPSHPLERSLKMIVEGSPEVICIDIAEKEAIALLEKLDSHRICVFKQALYTALTLAVPKHSYFYCQASADLTISPPNKDHNAYLMFTSGTTGKPKGIAISHHNLSEYIRSVCNLFNPTSEARIAQFSELTFDLSVHEIFTSWSVGATLYVVPESYLLGIKKFIQTHQITHLTSVPSNVTLLNQLKQLTPNCFPSIKQTFFCGEALLLSQANQWQAVAPNSEITNLYGPTEATVVITYFNFEKNINNSIVPIGKPFPNQYCALVSADGSLVNEGQIGELWLAGSQVLRSYWNNPIQSEKCFKYFSWDKEYKLWYRTGDLAEWNRKYGYLYHGRIDDQWQIRGYRVEKIEIENELRKIANSDNIAVVPIKSSGGTIPGVVAFVGHNIDVANLLNKARETLPNIMIPKKIITLDSLPKNSNGKIDYPYLSMIVRDE